MAIAFDDAGEFQPVLSRLERIKRTRWGWMARCPAHDDAKSSLSIKVDDDRMLLKCHAGCAFDSIVGAIGCETKDLFSKRGATMERKILGNYDYRDEQGTVLFQVVRFEPKDFRQRHPDGKGGWTWGMNGARRVLYRLPDLAKNPRRGVVIVEGEKDADRLVSLGLVATTNAMGAGKWLKEYSESLRGRRCVIIPDNDQPGREHAKIVSESLAGVASFVATLELDGLPEKGDVSDWLNAGHTGDELKKLIQDALKPHKEPSQTSGDRVRRILDTAKGLDRQSLTAAIHGLLNELEIQNLG